MADAATTGNDLQTPFALPGLFVQLFLLSAFVFRVPLTEAVSPRHFHQSFRSFLQHTRFQITIFALVSSLASPWSLMLTLPFLLGTPCLLTLPDVLACVLDTIPHTGQFPFSFVSCVLLPESMPLGCLF